MSRPVNLLILGGTGFLGRSLCESLVERARGGHGRLTIPSRHPQRAKAIQMLPTVELVRADVHDELELQRLVAGRDAVIHLVGTLHGDAAGFERVHVELPRKLARACAATGVRRVIHVSAIAATTDGPSLYLRTKAAGEELLRNADLDLTVLRPSVMFGAEDRFINLFARVQAVFPFVELAGADARFQPVWVCDVARAIATALDERDSIGRIYECTGPDVYTLAELVRLAGRWAGHPRPVLSLPPWAARLQATLMEWLPGTPLLSRDNLLSMQVPSVAQDVHPSLLALGIQPRAIEAIMPALLSGRAGPARLEALRQKRPRF